MSVSSPPIHHTNSPAEHEHDPARLPHHAHVVLTGSGHWVRVGVHDMAPLG